MGLPAFQLPMLQNVMHCREEICSTCLSTESMPFVKSKPPLSTRSLRSLRAAVRQQMCSMLASCLQKIELWLWYPSLRLQDIDCDLFKSTKNCRDSALSNRGFEAGLPAFQLQMFRQCDALPKRDLCDTFV